MDTAQFAKRCVRSLLQPVLISLPWFEESPGLTFHDPLAAAVIFDEHLYHFQRARSASVLSDPRRRRGNRTPDGPDAPHEVGVDVNRTAFFGHYFSV